jgi:hypothetical protein
MPRARRREIHVAAQPSVAAAAHPQGRSGAQVPARANGGWTSAWPERGASGEDDDRRQRTTAGCRRTGGGARTALAWLSARVRGGVPHPDSRGNGARRRGYADRADAGARGSCDGHGDGGAALGFGGSWASPAPTGVSLGCRAPKQGHRTPWIRGGEEVRRWTSRTRHGEKGRAGASACAAGDGRLEQRGERNSSTPRNGAGSARVGCSAAQASPVPWEEGSRAPCALGKKALRVGKKCQGEENGG